MARDGNSEFDRINKRITLYINILWGIAFAAVVLMFLSIAVAISIISSR